MTAFDFPLDVFTRSAYAASMGISNRPDAEASANLRHLWTELLRPLEQRLGRPLKYNSVFRSLVVNKGVGGMRDSQHLKGEAADIECPGLANLELSAAIQASGLPFDQLIEEFCQADAPSAGWIHVALRRANNRRQVLSARTRAARS